MIADTTYLIYFSPTRTTKQVLEGIAHGLGTDTIEHIDMTPPNTQTPVAQELHDAFALVGAPVYGGRIPIEAVHRLRRLKGDGSPAAIVVVYGNRAYEDALLELRDIVQDIGFNAAAGAAFIGEHSFSTLETPLAVARPDTKDLTKAEAFGALLREAMLGLSTATQQVSLEVPGSYPHRERGERAGITPVTDPELCGWCETCVHVCPTAAVTAKASIETDPQACILCCACVKNCPTGARTMDDERIRRTARWLYDNHSTRKEPEFFLCPEWTTL
jgi:ferredoxin/flavodoxin